MKQDFLHKLTGRLQGFISPLLDYGQTSGRLPSEVPLRQWLGLLDTDTDIHVRALLAAAVAYPEDSLVSGLHVDPTWIYPESFSMLGGELIGNGKHPPMDCYAPTTFPFATSWELRYASATAADLVRGQRSTRVRVLTNSASLAVEWPEDSGIFGNVKLHQSWAPGAVVTMHVPARNYPYGALMRGLFLRADAVKLMAAQGVAEAAHACPNPVRAAALLVKALTF